MSAKKISLNLQILYVSYNTHTLKHIDMTAYDINVVMWGRFKIFLSQVKYASLRLPHNQNFVSVIAYTFFHVTSLLPRVKYSTRGSSLCLPCERQQILCSELTGKVFSLFTPGRNKGLIKNKKLFQAGYEETQTVIALSLMTPVIVRWESAHICI